jgi:hypothetical protein
MAMAINRRGGGGWKALLKRGPRSLVFENAIDAHIVVVVPRGCLVRVGPGLVPHGLNELDPVRDDGLPEHFPFFHGCRTRIPMVALRCNLDLVVPCGDPHDPVARREMIPRDQSGVNVCSPA